MLSVSAIYIALCGLLVIALSTLSISVRQSTSIGLGSGGNRKLEAAMRCQGNNAEYIPVTLLLLAAAELNGASATLLHAAGAAFVFSRIWHAQGFMAKPGTKSAGRFYGTLITWLVITFLAAVNLLLSFKVL